MENNTLLLKHTENMAFVTEINGFELQLDGGKSDDNDPKGITPKKLLLASLAGCTAMDVAAMLKTMRVEFQAFSITVNAPIAEQHPKVYTELALVYTIKVQDKDKPKVEKAVNLSKTKYCGVSAMLGKAAPIPFEIRFLPWHD